MLGENTSEEKEEGKSKPLAVLPPPPPTEGVEIPEKKPKELPRLVEVLIPLAEKLEDEYKRQKNKEIEDLHNELADIILKFKNERNIHLSHILTALEIVKHELVFEALRREGLIKTG